ncbi:MAG: PilZ domain-containing protein [Proteobacteria bacterium]|nr:PilZ domain-containing protein [Pseudomonadota bacterium]
MASGKGVKESESSYVHLRAHRRRELSSQIVVRRVKESGTSGVFFGYAKMIGYGGMFVASVSPKSVGEEVELLFEAPDGSGELHCNAVVVWQREFESGFKVEPGMGVKFIDLDEKVRKEIDDWVMRK